MQGGGAVAVHPDRLRVISTQPLPSSSSPAYPPPPSRPFPDDSSDSRDPKRRRHWRGPHSNDSAHHRRYDRRDQHRDDDHHRHYRDEDGREEGGGHSRSHRWDRRRDARDRSHVAEESSDGADPIRFLSSITVERQEEPSQYSTSPTTYVLVQGLPAACDEATLHSFCHPFHCVSHRFLSTSPPSCVIHFDDRMWSQQFHTVHSDKLKLDGDVPVHMEFVHRHYADSHSGESHGERDRPLDNRREESGGVGGNHGWSDQEEGEVDVQVEETPAIRSARLDREFDLSSLTTLCGDESMGVLVVSGLPSEVQVESLHADDVIRYSFAPFAAVRWTAKKRLKQSNEFVAFVAFHSSADAQLVFDKRADVRILDQPVTVSHARRMQTASNLPQEYDVTSATVTVASSDAPSRPPHLPPTYQYQMETGYWHDGVSGLFYHPTTGVYWDPRTEQHLAWNAATQQYALIPKSTDTSTAASPLPLGSALSTPASSSSTQSSSVEVTPVPKQPIRLTLSSTSTKAPSRPLPPLNPLLLLHRVLP